MVSLSKGRRGPDVSRWQDFLIEQGLLNATADGVFGDETAAATRAFQQQRGLKADGIVGAVTLGVAQALGYAASRRVRDGEVTSDLSAHAKVILKEHWRAPFGSEFPFESAGKRYYGRIEQHYHPPGGPLKPWGYHPGVSLFIEVSVGPSEAVLDGTEPRA
jgi:peptidoglycan hydrolase-like protein with peptidoglycan-binding domain